MRSTDTKDHGAAGPSPGPRSGSRQLPRTTDPLPPGLLLPSPPEIPDASVDRPQSPYPADARDVRGADQDVPYAVTRALDAALDEHLTRAAGLDPVFKRDIADRVARFTQDGGKRLRSQFAWWAWRACGGTDPADARAVLDIGAALELVQTCALVHDDVMDGARLRRGRLSLHADVTAQYAYAVPDRGGERLGEAAAILAGDLALAWADDLVAAAVTAPATDRRVRDVWSAMRTEMVAGQYLDVQGQATSVRSVARAVRAACLKSALYTVERPMALGAAVAGADVATTRALCSAGRCVGMAFQLRDDLHDVFGDTRSTGKPSGGDVRDGKPTYLVAVAQARAEAAGDHRALAVLRRRLGSADLTETDLDQVREVLVATGARATVEAKIARLAEQGTRHLNRAVLDTGPRRRPVS
ncbi:polyprenyl synthetase family protein [Streptomyces resistomycificus]|uniref:polyprenyl synthetase family protein n=1 Tax=Streptomyces resistomycificus TaxID=67356 RepID=UPI00099698A9|nr:polyprenyl synthetase family protein [Streptomyces resistomycificus]